jgi:molybdopterin-guanine dinucleotide biosynthesis protein A
MHVSGIILAGGKSRRMGTDKRTLTIADGLTLLDSVESVLLAFCDEVIVVNNKDVKDRSESVKEVVDIYSGAGPLAGIHAGLAAAKNETAFVVACDMPFIEEDLIRYLLSLSSDYDVTVLKQGDKAETLHAVYKKSALTVIEDSLAAGEFKVSTIFQKLRVKYIDVSEIPDKFDYQRILLNINRPEDYAQAVSRWKKFSENN